MIALMAEAAARSVGLALVVAACVTALRLRNPHIEKSTWATVLIASLAMPILVVMPVRPFIRAGASNILLVLRTSSGTVAHIGASWASAATMLYCLIALVLLWRQAAGLARVWRIRSNSRALKEAWTDGLDVRVTSEFAVPATFGSTILLPAAFVDWADKKLAAVIAHERSHVVEKDAYLLWLSRLNTCLFWFNPSAWWLDHKIAALAEATSDEAALSTVGDRPAYAEILLEFANERFADRVVTPIGRSMVASRIEHIIGTTTSPSAPARLRRWLAVAALLPAIAASAISLQATPPRAVQTSDPQRHVDAAPRVTNWGGNLEKYYPPEAEQSGVDGIVNIAVTLDPTGHPTDSHIQSEDPPGMGFGAAASAVARSMEYSNPTGRKVQFAFRVKFALSHKAATN